MPVESSNRSPFGDLVAALTADDLLVQADAARLLGELRRPESVTPLLRYVTDDRHYSKVAGFHALAEIGDRSISPSLRPLVSEPNCPDDWYWYGRRSVQTAAAVALLALGDESGVPFLLALADAGDEVLFCWYGPAVLKMAGSSAALESVRSRITSQAICEGTGRRFADAGFTVMTARTLGLLGDPLACDKLLELLSHQSRYVRGQAAMSLLGAGATSRHLQAVRNLLPTDPTDFVKIKATLALHTAGQGDTGLIAQLARTADDAFDRAVAVEAIGLTGDAAHRAEVVAALSHADSYVKRCAVEAIELLSARQPGDDSSTEIIRRLLDDPHALVRLQAAKYFAARPFEVEAKR